MRRGPTDTQVAGTVILLLAFFMLVCAGIIALAMGVV
jgi:hypothetical protein